MIEREIRDRRVLAIHRVGYHLNELAAFLSQESYEGAMLHMDAAVKWSDVLAECDSALARDA